MKRLLFIAVMMTVALSVLAQNKPIYRDPVYQNHLKRYQTWRSAQPRQNMQVTQQQTTTTTNQLVQTIVVRENNAAEVDMLRSRMDQLERELKKTKRHWYNKYSAGDCLMKSGHRSNAEIGIGIAGAAVTGGLVYFACKEDDPHKKDIFKYSAIGSGALTTIICFSLHMSAIKWKIRAGKKSNLDLEFRGNEVAINF